MKMRKLLCLVLSLVLVLSLAACGKSGGKKEKSGETPESVAEKYMKYDIAGDAAKVYELFHEKVVDEIKGDKDADAWKDWVDDISEEREDAFKAKEDQLGGKLKVSYEISDTRDLKGDDLEDIQEMYEKLGVEVKAAKVVEFDVELKGQDDEEEFTVEVTLIQVDLFWYVDIYSALYVI